jgi:hypothetical protein
MANIDAYKVYLGAGARENLFKLEVQVPASVIASGLLSELSQSILTSIGGAINISISSPKVNDIIPIMVHEINFPATRKITSSAIVYEGETYHLPNEREKPTEITLKFRNEENFYTHHIFEVWMNYIMKPKFGPHKGNMARHDTFKTDVFNIFMLNKNFVPSKKVSCLGVYPISVSEISLDYTKGNIVETTVILSVDHIEHYGNPSVFRGVSKYKNLVP